MTWLDENTVRLVGRLATKPGVSEDGRAVVLEVSMRHAPADKKRVDVIPVVFWGHPVDGSIALPDLVKGTGVSIEASVQRRFRTVGVGERISSIEIIGISYEVVEVDGTPLADTSDLFDDLGRRCGAAECITPIPPGSVYCSPTCEHEVEANLRSQP